MLEVIMHSYKIETTITQDGKIILPQKLRKIFNHRVEIHVLDKEVKNKKKNLDIPAFSCGGKLTDFTRTELYGTRI